MLQGELPFGSWRESELDTFAKIAKGQLNLPQTFSPEVVDFITKVLQKSLGHGHLSYNIYIYIYSRRYIFHIRTPNFLKICSVT